MADISPDELHLIRTQARNSGHGGNCAATILRLCDSVEVLRAERDEARRERDEAEARRAGMALTLDATMGDATRYEIERDEWRGRAERAEAWARFNGQHPGYCKISEEPTSWSGCTCGLEVVLAGREPAGEKNR